MQRRDKVQMDKLISYLKLVQIFKISITLARKNNEEPSHNEATSIR